MYTIAYDESSGFESFDRQSRVPTIIAGVVFDDKNEKLNNKSETDIEQLRVFSYLRNICNDTGNSFPGDLHVEWNNGSSLKNALIETLGEFFSKGTYHGKDLLYLSKDGAIIESKEDGCTPLIRKGDYQLHTMIKTLRGVSESFSKGAILKDDEASNTYINMVKAYLRNAVFLNPSVSGDSPSVYFTMPTRRMPTSKVHDSNNKDAYRKFYSTEQRNGENTYGIVSENDNRLFASIIDDFSRNLREITVCGDINPVPISRGYNRSNPNKRFAFLFLSDILTSVLKSNIYDYVINSSRRKAVAIMRAYEESDKDFGEDSVLIEDMIQKIKMSYRTFTTVTSSDVVSVKRVQSDRAKKWLKYVKDELKKIDDQSAEEFAKEKEPLLRSIVSDLNSMVLSNSGNAQRVRSLQTSIDNINRKINKTRPEVPDESCIIVKGFSQKNTQLFDIKERIKSLNQISDGEFHKEIFIRMIELNSDGQNCLYCYDDIDQFYYSAFQCLKNSDLFGLYSNIYEGTEGFHPGLTLPDQTIQKYYRDNLFKNLENEAEKNAEKMQIVKAIGDLIEYRFSDNRNSGKFLFIFEKVYDLYMNHVQEREPLENKYLFRLYDAGMSAYTHVGNTIKAMEFYNKCMGIKTGIGKDERMLVKNRLITIYNDLLDYKNAERIACEILEIKSENTLLQAIRRSIANWLEKPVQPKIRGDITEPVVYKTASSLGQTYAFMNNNLAESFFQEVINNKEPDPDLNITVSYCLHWYIESNQQEKYEELAQQYFGGNIELHDQLAYLINKGTEPSGKAPFSMDYALFVFVKAFYMFYRKDNRYQDIREQLVHINETVDKMLEEKKKLTRQEMPIALPYRTQGHPWEIIYKYSALLEEGINESAVPNIEKTSLAVFRRRKGGIIDLVVRYGELEYKENRMVNGDRNGNSETHIIELIEELWSLVKQNPDIYSGWTECDGDVGYKRSQLSRMFSYMYH